MTCVTLAAALVEYIFYLHIYTHKHIQLLIVVSFSFHKTGETDNRWAL